MLLMLEDDAERTTQFETALSTLPNPPALQVWADAHRMIAEAPALMPHAKLISLDHDLIPEDGMPDPGDGYSVVQWLTSQPYIRPVIIHTSNAERAAWMSGEFDLNGWTYHRVLPLDRNWIFDWWLPTVREILATQ